MTTTPTLLPFLRRAPHGGRERAVRVGLRLAAALLLGVSAAAVAPSADALAADTPAGPGADLLDQPSIQYQEAIAHANDPNTFTPGDAVSVPFGPRAANGYEVDGAAPVALPAGRASGRSMAASPQGSGQAIPDVAAPVEPPKRGQAVAYGVVNQLRREVFGFLPYWESSYTPNYDILSTVAYFGVGMNGSGDLIKKDSDGSTSTGWGGWTSSWMTKVLNGAHANGTRVVITIECFAWSSSQAATQTALLSSPQNRANGIAQIVAAITDRGADGVNLDFEPIASGQSANFVTFVRDLRTALNAAHSGYELTYDATGRGTTYNTTNLLASGGADAVFIMGYDFRSIDSTYAASMDPLTSPKIFDLTDSINRYKAWAPTSKLILGLPYYGRKYVTVDDKIYSTCTYTASNITFTSAQAYMRSFGRRYDSIEQAAWTAYFVDPNWFQIYYDDAQALGARADMINYWNLRGMGIWALGYDAGYDDAANVVASRFLTDKTPPKVGIVNIAPAQHDEGFAVTWTGRDDWNGIRNYDVQVSTDGGAFAAWLTATTLTGSNYQGQTGHNYAFRVRATDGAGNVGPWDVSATYTAAPSLTVGGFVSVAVDSLNERSDPTASGSVVRTAGRGTVLQLIGGPVEADGYTWYQVTGPFASLNAVEPLFPGPWVAAGDGSSAYITPITPPNSTAVTAGISGLVVGTPGLAPSGTGLDRGKFFSPDGDGIHDSLPLAWTNNLAFDAVTITVYASDGNVAGTIGQGSQGAGPQSFVWNGIVDGATEPVPDGQYMLQVSGMTGGSTYSSPSAAPFSEGQWASFGVVIDTTPTGTYFTLQPVRVLDTRYGTGLSGALVAGKARSFAVAGQNGVPANAIAVTGNLTVTQATAKGYVQLGPTVDGTSSTLNLLQGDDRANGVTVGLDSGGNLSALFVSGASGASVHAIFDVTGYFVVDPAGATFIGLPSTRMVDTRIKQGVSAPLAANQVTSFQVTGVAGVPANAIAVTGNATITGPTSRGYVLVAPSITPGVQPPTSTLNFPAGDTRANNLVVPLDSGNLAVEFVGTTGATTQFVFDVTGYFVPDLSGATFVPLAPGRIVDSRKAQGFKGPLKNGSSVAVAASGLASVHSIAIAVVGNLTVTSQTSSGWLSIGPARTTDASTLNFPLRDDRANGFASLLGPGGTLTVTFGGAKGSSVQVVVDILGYYR
jgi:spore germination protein YaaH